MTTLNSSAFLADFLTKGFHCFNAADFLQLCPIEKFQTVTVKHADNCFHAEGHEFHNEIMTSAIKGLMSILTGSVLYEFDASLAFDFFADKPNDHVVKFHSDAQYAMPGQNATINCFFDDTDETTGGRFDMSPYREDIFGKSDDVPGMASVYPKMYDIIIFNQNRNFLHKVTSANSRRRMISFACTFHDINPLHPNWVPA
jgi:hypothetical protein